MRIALACLLAATACGHSPATADGSVGLGGDGGDGDAAAEQQPTPAPGTGVADPDSASLHDHGCGGVDWQYLGGWLLVAHQPAALAPAGELDRCVARYAGWVTNEADHAGVSRASVYAALAATGQCAAAHDYNGMIVSGALCASVNPGVVDADCAAHMASSRGFGIATVARVIGKLAAKDAPLIAAGLSDGTIACGGTDRWKLVAPAGFVDAFVAAYNSYQALSTPPPTCKKLIVVSVALYTGMAQPAGSNGCWTYERVAKDNPEWKLCQYDGTVYHPSGVKWAYDDTNTYNDLATETTRISACRSGPAVGGYIYMANRGSGWRQVTSTGVRSHFAEIYSSQTAVDDQFAAWQAAGEPGAPMINLGEPQTTASQIAAATAQACGQVPTNDWLGIYVYPQTLDGARLAAMVGAINACTKS